MIENNNSVTLNQLNAMIGDGGIEKLERISKEIEDQNKQTEDELNFSKNKKFGDLSPLEQIIFNLDKTLDNAKRIRESQNMKYLRDQQFREYARNVYGISEY